MSRSSDMLAAMIAKKEAGATAPAGDTKPTPSPKPTPTSKPAPTSTRGKGKGGSGASNPRNNPATFSLGGGVEAPKQEELDYMNATYGESPAEPDSLDTIMSRYTGKVPDYSGDTEEFYRQPKDYAAAIAATDSGYVKGELEEDFLAARGYPASGEWEDRAAFMAANYPRDTGRVVPSTDHLRNVASPTAAFLEQSEREGASEARDKFQHGMAETRTKALILAAGTKQAGKPPDIARFNRAQEKYRLGLPLRTEDLAPEFQGKAGALDELTAALEALTVEPTYDIDKASRVNPFGA